MKLDKRILLTAKRETNNKKELQKQADIYSETLFKLEEGIDLLESLDGKTQRKLRSELKKMFQQQNDIEDVLYALDFHENKLSALKRQLERKY